MADELRHHSWERIDIWKQFIKLRYPYHEWFNGSIWLLRNKEDFTVTTLSLQSTLRQQAVNWNYRIRMATHLNGHDLYLQFLGPKTDRWRRHLEQLEISWLWQKAFSKGYGPWWDGSPTAQGHHLKTNMPEWEAIREYHSWKHRSDRQRYRHALVLEFASRLSEEDFSTSVGVTLQEHLAHLPDWFRFFEDEDPRITELSRGWAEYRAKKGDQKDNEEFALSRKELRDKFNALRDELKAEGHKDIKWKRVNYER